MLPFDGVERRRYGASWTHARLVALRQIHARSFSEADGVIFLTEYAFQCIRPALGAAAPERMAIIPHGVDARFRNAPRSARPLSSCTEADPLRLVYVSIVAPYKHQWVVADAVGALRAAGLPVSIEFIGGEESAASMAQLRASIARHDPSGAHIRFSGAVPFSKVDACYRRADVFVFASSCENMPNILLEAMAAGLPIACSERGPMPEVLGDAGVYFDPEDTDDVAAALRRLAEDDGLRARCGQRAFDRAAQYSWQRCADETFTFLAEVARRHRAGA
jgi:glycosyltransferase involved in cell wall biosynthesis